MMGCGGAHSLEQQIAAQCCMSVGRPADTCADVIFSSKTGMNLTAQLKQIERIGVPLRGPANVKQPVRQLSYHKNKVDSGRHLPENHD